MIENYNKAKRYLFKVNSEVYKDVLHDAFLNYFRRTGLNLFDRPNGNVIGVVKNEYFSYLRSKMFRRHGERLPFQFTTFEDHSFTSVTPEDILIGEETQQQIESRLSSFEDPRLAGEVLRMRMEGYNTKEISKELYLSIQQVKRYTTSLRKDRPGKARMSNSEIDEILYLHSKGLTLTQICNRTKRSIKTVWSAVNNNKYGIQPTENFNSNNQEENHSQNLRGEI
jgi:DNA-binding CsgD family transcriptional regulator